MFDTELGDEWVKMPHSIFLNQEDLGGIQNAAVEFAKKHRAEGKKIILELDEDHLRANADPWLLASYNVGSNFVIAMCDRVDVNYRGETRTIKQQRGGHDL